MGKKGRNENEKISNYFIVSFFLTILGFLILDSAFAEPKYKIIHLGSLYGDDCHALSINNFSQIVGSCSRPDGGNEAFLWTKNDGLIELEDQFDRSVATKINDNGLVIGHHRTSGVIGYRGFYWRENIGAIDFGIQPNATNNSNFPNGVNNNDVIVGDSYGSGGYIWTEENGYTIIPGSNVEARAINDAGIILGTTTSFPLRHAYIWSESIGMVDLGTLGGSFSYPSDINNNGWVVGYSNSHAFLWTEETGIIDLGSPGTIGSSATAINNKGEIVGVSTIFPCINNCVPGYPQESHAFLYKNGNWYDLNNLIPENSGWDVLRHATDINDSGQIIGDGRRDGIYNAIFLMSPIIEVVIDIKPGNENNCININDHGVIPVAIIGSDDFDVTQVDPATCSLQGMTVKMAGKSNKLLCNYTDVNEDGYDDLLLKIEDSDGNFEEGQAEATLTCALYDETTIEGTDTICIVP